MVDVVISAAIDGVLASGTTRAPIAINFVSPVTISVSSFKIWTLAGGQTVKGNIYARSGTTTTTPMGGDSAVINTVAGGQLVVPLSSPANLVAGGAYSVVLNQSISTSLYGADDASSVTRYRSTALAAMTDPLPNPFASISNTGANKFPYLILTSSVPSILSIDQLVEGATSTIVFSEAFTPTSLPITDGVRTATVTSFAGSGTTWTFTAPALTHGVVSPKIGSVTVTASAGANTTSGYVVDYIKTGYNAVILTSVDADNYRAGTLPALEVGSQVVKPLAIDIALDGVDSSNTPGTFVLFDISPSDGVARSYTLINSGEPEPPVDVPTTGVRQRSLLRVTGNVLQIDGVTHTNGQPVALSPYGGLQSGTNGAWIAQAASAASGDLVVDGVTITPPKALYVSPAGKLTATPNGQPVATVRS